MIYDVTLPISPSLVRWPGDPAVEVEQFGGEVRISRWSLGSHAGTHIDAPAHFGLEGTVDQIDLDVLLGPCTVLDLTDFPLVTADLLDNSNLVGIKRLLLRTRSSLRWQQDTTTFDEQYVGINASAARLLLSLGVKLIGVDGLSVEPYDGTGDVHELLLAAGVVIVEGLNLSEVPAGEYELICAPLKLQDSDGAPARVWLRG